MPVRHSLVVNLLPRKEGSAQNATLWDFVGILLTAGGKSVVQKAVVRVVTEFAAPSWAHDTESDTVLQ